MQTRREVIQALMQPSKRPKNLLRLLPVNTWASISPGLRAAFCQAIFLVADWAAVVGFRVDADLQSERTHVCGLVKGGSTPGLSCGTWGFPPGGGQTEEIVH